MSDEFTRNHLGDDLPPEADLALRWVQQRLTALGEEWRARPLDTAPLVGHLRALAAGSRTSHSSYPLQEDFVLMQAASSQIAPAPHVARRRRFIAPVAAVLVAVLGVVIFAKLGHRPATDATTVLPSVTTITPAIRVVSPTRFQRYPTGNNVVNALLPANTPDGALWFSDQHIISPHAFRLAIARWTPDGTIQTYDLPNTDVQLNNQNLDNRLELIEDIITGPDGNLWFVHTYNQPNHTALRSEIVRMTPAGQFTFFPLPPFAGNSLPPALGNVTIGPDGNLWFAANYSDSSEHAASRVGRITLTGQVTWFDVAPAGYNVGAVTNGPDHHLWIAANAETPAASSGEDATPARPGALLGRMDTKGNVTYRHLGSVEVNSLRFNADGSLWLMDYSQMRAQVERFDLATNHITAYHLPDESLASRLVFAPDGTLWLITGTGTSLQLLTVRHLYRLSPQGGLTRVQLPGDNMAAYVAFSADGQMWLSDFTYHGPGLALKNFTSYIARVTP